MCFGREAAKPALDDFVWDGSAVAGITLQTSPDNKKIVASRMFVAGTLMQNRKELKASRLFVDADKDLKISYIIEESSMFTFKSGTTIGDYLEDDKVDWEVLKKGPSGTTTIDSSEYEDNKIGDFCLRPFLVPLSSSRAKLTILAFL